CDELARAGYGVEVYCHGRRKDIDRERMMEWLKSLPAPCGVFVAYDQLARSVLDICRAEKLDIPKRLQVLSVDDEDFICELSIPTLSSIAPDYETGGVLALDVLDGLLNGSERSGRNLKLPVQAVVERMSTSDFTDSANRVAVAREYIRRHATEGIGVQNVASRVAGSCRMLEKDFRSILGHTIRDEIVETRLAAVRRLLRNSSVPIDQIAAKCGFSSGNYLKNLFRRRYGMTMRDYRNGK
ncbi:MAG: substrate-binding domain-containing protein, partial [bacterium]|nr:substrate-binding domain-containing protein [Candidatus Colisoma equi]